MFGFFKRSQKNTFEDLALPHMDSLYSTALRLCRSESEAEDLVQETMLKAFRFFHRFQQGTHIKAWLFKILTNTFINQYRKQQRDREIVEDWDWDQLLPSEDRSQDAEKQILDRTMSRHVLEAIEKVPVDFRMVVLLADLEDFSYKEIAEIVDCPIGTVMSRLYRGRRILGRLLYDFAVEQGYIPALAPPEASDGPEPSEKVAQIDDYRRVRAEKKQSQSR